MWPAKVIRLDPDCALEAHRARRPSTRKQYQPFLLVTVHGRFRSRMGLVISLPLTFLVFPPVNRDKTLVFEFGFSLLKVLTPIE